MCLRNVGTTLIQRGHNVGRERIESPPCGGIVDEQEAMPAGLIVKRIDAAIERVLNSGTGEGGVLRDLQKRAPGQRARGLFSFPEWWWATIGGSSRGETGE
jgi:hypothetical protein